MKHVIVPKRAGSQVEQGMSRPPLILYVLGRIHDVAQDVGRKAGEQVEKVQRGQEKQQGDQEDVGVAARMMVRRHGTILLRRPDEPGPGRQGRSPLRGAVGWPGPTANRQATATVLDGPGDPRGPFSSGTRDVLGAGGQVERQPRRRHRPASRVPGGRQGETSSRVERHPVRARVPEPHARSAAVDPDFHSEALRSSAVRHRALRRRHDGL